MSLKKKKYGYHINELLHEKKKAFSRPIASKNIGHVPIFGRKEIRYFSYDAH